MSSKPIIDKASFAIALVTFFFSLWFFYKDTELLFDSVFAAALAAGVMWGTYMVFRLCMLAFRH